MQLVGSPNKGCKVFGRQLNPQESKFLIETIFNHLVVPYSQNFIDTLMTTDSQGRMDFIAHKISEENKVKIQKVALSAPKTQLILRKLLYFSAQEQQTRDRQQTSC